MTDFNKKYYVDIWGKQGVIHSQGVWGYFPQEDIQKAWAESVGYDPKLTKALLERNTQWISNNYLP